MHSAKNRSSPDFRYLISINFQFCLNMTPHRLQQHNVKRQKMATPPQPAHGTDENQNPQQLHQSSTKTPTKRKTNISSPQSQFRAPLVDRSSQRLEGVRAAAEIEQRRVDEARAAAETEERQLAEVCAAAETEERHASERRELERIAEERRDAERLAVEELAEKGRLENARVALEAEKRQAEQARLAAVEAGRIEAQRALRLRMKESYELLMSCVNSGVCSEPDEMMARYQNRALAVMAIATFTRNRTIGYLQRLFSTSLKGDDASQLLIDMGGQLGICFAYSATKNNIASIVETAEKKVERVCDALNVGWVQDNVEEYVECPEGTLEKRAHMTSRTNTSKIYYKGDIPILPTSPAIPLAELKPDDLLPNPKTFTDYLERQSCIVWNILIEKLPEFAGIAPKRPSCGNTRRPVKNDLIPAGLMDHEQGTLAGMAKILDDLAATHGIPAKGSEEARTATAKRLRRHEIGSNDVHKFNWVEYVMGEFHFMMAVIERFLKIFKYNGLEERGTIGWLGRFRDSRFVHDGHDKFTFYEKERLVKDACKEYVTVLGRECSDKLGETVEGGREVKLEGVVLELVRLVEEHESGVVVDSQAVPKGGKNKGGQKKEESFAHREKPVSKRAYLLEFVHFGLMYLVYDYCISTGDGVGIVDMHKLFLPLLKDGGGKQASRYFNAVLHEQAQLLSILRQDMAYRSMYFRVVNPKGEWNTYFPVDQRQEHFNKHLKECKGIKHTEEFPTAYDRSLAANAMFKAKQQLAVGLGLELKNGYHPPPSSKSDVEAFYADLTDIGMLSDAPDASMEALLVTRANMDLLEEARLVIEVVRARNAGIQSGGEMDIDSDASDESTNYDTD
ncbi:hypothetical protein HDU98_002185 [Podochytrium sp. JEL0797]|nr:hypothetical protein HDU98_002185 [Podochytrium sp. JEL0797]